MNLPTDYNGLQSTRIPKVDTTEVVIPQSHCVQVIVEMIGNPNLVTFK